MEVSNAVLAEKIDNLQTSINELKDTLRQLDGEQRQSELDAVRDHTRIEGKADAANNRLDIHSRRLEKVERDLPNLILAYRIMATVGGVLGVSVIALIWSLITGQAHITFTP
jgi:predicted RNase H-like nuclease (RuvC/YqgF family)